MSKRTEREGWYILQSDEESGGDRTTARAEYGPFDSKDDAEVFAAQHSQFEEARGPIVKRP